MEEDDACTLCTYDVDVCMYLLILLRS